MTSRPLKPYSSRANRAMKKAQKAGLCSALKEDGAICGEPVSADHYLLCDWHLQELDDAVDLVEKMLGG
jgi:hypothetical protein